MLSKKEVNALLTKLVDNDDFLYESLAYNVLVDHLDGLIYDTDEGHKLIHLAVEVLEAKLARKEGRPMKAIHE